MKLPEFAVKNYQFTLVVFLAVLAMGIYSLFTMPAAKTLKFTRRSLPSW
jgi:multidrug efflux pump subunit AcrB